MELTAHAKAARNAPTFDDEDEAPHVRHGVNRRIRANSSIMHLNKILGAHRLLRYGSLEPYSPPRLQSLTLCSGQPRRNPSVASTGTNCCAMTWQPQADESAAIRIFRTAHELSLHTVAIFSYEDRMGMHRQSEHNFLAAR